MPLTIRAETISDHSSVYELIKIAFQTANVSDGTEQDFYEALKKSPRFIPALTLVAEKNNHIIGQIMLTHFYISCKNGTKHPSLLLAPIAIVKEHRVQGIGTALMKEAIKRAKEQGFESIILVGNPSYYNRFGFKQATTFSITNQNDIPDIYALALELTPDSLYHCAGQVNFDVVSMS